MSSWTWDTGQSGGLPLIRLPTLGFDPVGSSPGEFAAQIKAEIGKWVKVIRDAGIKPL
jgi:hypothetical protein